MNPFALRLAGWLVRALPLLLAAALGAQGVQLDAAFLPIVSDGRAAGRFLALQPDGKILADNARVRYHADGSRDTAYTLGPALGFITAARVAFDGKIVLQSRTERDDLLIQLNPDGSFDRILVAALPGGTLATLQADGKILLTSPILLSLNGVTRNGIARLNRDGTLDAAFDPGFGPDAQIESISLQADGRILVGGFFRTFDRLPRPHLVRLDPNGTVDQSFTAAVANVITEVLAVPDGKVIAFEGLSRRLLRLNADGTLDLVLGAESGSAAQIYALAVQPGGYVLAGGGFTHFGDSPRRNLVRLNPDGSLDRTFEASAPLTFELNSFGSGVITQLAVQDDGKILFAESSFSNTAGDRLLRLNADGSPDATFQPGQPRAPAALTAARHDDGRIAIAGTFTFVNGVARPGLARLNADGSLDASFAPAAGADAPITALAALPDGRVVAAGAFTGVGGAARSGLARFAANGALDSSFDFTLSLGGKIAALAALPDGRVVIGGEFSAVNGSARGNLAAFLASGTLDPGFAATAALNGPVRLLALRAGGGIFAAGTFSTVAGQRRNLLAAFAADGSLDLSFAATSLTTADAITVLAATPDGGAIIGGPTPGNSLRSALRRVRRSGDFDPAYAFGLAVNANFSALVVDAQGRALAAYTGIETFETGTDTSHRYLQRFSPAGALDPSFNVGTGPSAPITSLLLAPDGSVLLGGLFTRVDDLPVGQLVRLRPANVPPPGRILNLSTRGETSPGATVLTAGFVLAGSLPKTVLIRAVGPALAGFGVDNSLPDPRLVLIRADGTSVATNDNWSGANFILPRASAPDAGYHVARTAARVGAFPLPSALEAALVVTLAPGNYTAQVVAAGGTRATGITLVEVYDANVFPGDRRMVNISTRGRVGPDERTLIAGFVITGSAAKLVLVRAAGPGLVPFQVGDTLVDPILTVVNHAGATVATNDDWSAGVDQVALSAAAAKVGAFAFADPSKDSALLLNLAPGNYTALVSGANATNGVALVEVYEVP